MTDDKREGVLGRWSRLKRTRNAVVETGRRGAAAPAVSDPGGDEKTRTSMATAESDTPAALEQPPIPEDLPAIDTLGKDSDYTVFLRAGVPEDLRRQALRALWRSDPLLANLDGLNDFDEDYRTADGVVEIVRTAYRVGKGYLDAEDETAATEEAEEHPERIAAPAVDEAADETAPVVAEIEGSAAVPVDGSDRTRRKT